MDLLKPFVVAVLIMCLIMSFQQPVDKPPEMSIKPIKIMPKPIIIEKPIVIKEIVEPPIIPPKPPDLTPF